MVSRDGSESISGPGGSTHGEFAVISCGFAIAAFQEETLFRGFLQRVFDEQYGRVVAIVGQSGIFTLAHLGYYPISAWPLLLVVFLVGLVTG